MPNNISKAFKKVAETYERFGMEMSEEMHGRIPEDYQRLRWQRIKEDPVQGIRFIKELGRQTGQTSEQQLNRLWEEYKADMRRRYPDV